MLQGNWLLKHNLHEEEKKIGNTPQEQKTSQLMASSLFK